MDKALYDEWYKLEDKHWWFLGRREIFKSFLELYLKKYPARILDIGCGTEINMNHLERYGGVMGMDPSRSAIEYSLKRKAYVLC